MDKALNYLALARKAGRAELGEEPVGAADHADHIPLGFALPAAHTLPLRDLFLHTNYLLFLPKGEAYSSSAWLSGLMSIL